MRTIVNLLFFILLLSNYSWAQKTLPKPKNEALVLAHKKDSISAYHFGCRLVITEACFENGPIDFTNYLQKNLDYSVPANNGCPPERYTVKINFVVSKEGKVTYAKALTNHGYGMENEAIRMIMASPKWKPATKNGRCVSAFLQQEISFDVCDSAILNL